jgi:hypothetical protein
MDVVDRLRAVVRSIVTPMIDRLALYRAEVKAASSDGKTLDVDPEDSRISGIQGVPIRVGIPGAVAVVQPGAVVLIGWERGDPSRPYAVPSWESGASVTKLVVNATELYLGTETGAKKLATEDHTHTVTYVPGTSGTATATTDPPTAGLTTNTKAT